MYSRESKVRHVREKIRTKRPLKREPFHVLLSKSERAKLTKIARRRNQTAADVLRWLLEGAS